MSTIRHIVSGLFSRFISAAKAVRIESYIIAVILVAAFIVRIAYLNVTPYTVRSHDVGEHSGHAQYIEYIAHNLSLPARDLSDQTYHPPLYYIVSAVFYDIFSAFKLQSDAIYKNLQFLSILYSMGFLIAAILLLKKYISNKPILIVSTLVLSFWPSLIIHSVRIGNDPLFYLFFSLALLFLFDWFDTGDAGRLLLFGAFTTFSILTKANGIMLIALFGILALILFFREKNKIAFIVKLVPVIVVFAFALAYTFLFPLMEMGGGHKDVSLISRSAGLPEGLFVGNEPKNYLYIDLKTFTQEPFTSPWDDQFGRQFYWNYYFKTALFGEFSFSGAIVRNSAMIVSVLFLGILVYMLVFAFSLRKGENKNILPLFISILVLQAIAIVFRIYIPCSCSTDFRYMVPIIIPFIVFFGKGIDFFREKKLYVFEYAGYAIGIGFALFSAIFTLAIT
jgi:4-amino-4-deoxy-L-arabinose transferase-like glycosyltransferase